MLSTSCCLTDCNPVKIEVLCFQFNNRLLNHQLKIHFEDIVLCQKRLPKYLVRLNETLSFNQGTPYEDYKSLAAWSSSVTTLRTTALGLVYTVTEYFASCVDRQLAHRTCWCPIQQDYVPLNRHNYGHTYLLATILWEETVVIEYKRNQCQTCATISCWNSRPRLAPFKKPPACRN